tara:strand:- start:313 stop:540 length:228 start_codon:yes stop_codon:yes gene_type:complete
MKIAVKPDLKSQTFSSSKSYTLLEEKEISLVKIKFYQKFFVLLLSLSSFLIFTETPRELENICQSYNSRKICNVW